LEDDNILNLNKIEVVNSSTIILEFELLKYIKNEIILNIELDLNLIPIDLIDDYIITDNTQL